MSEMIDRIAQAIFDVAPFRENCGPFSEQSDLYQRLTKVYARAAIQAMRDPTDEMINALWAKEEEMQGGGCGRDMFIAAIDAALGD